MTERATLCPYLYTPSVNAPGAMMCHTHVPDIYHHVLHEFFVHPFFIPNENVFVLHD